MLVSLPMSTYTDFQEFMSSVPHGDSKKYHEMRDIYLTSKHRIFDIGLTITFMSVLFFGLGKKWSGVRNSLSSGASSVKAAFALPVLFGVCYIFDIFQVVLRGEVPVWADTLAIPLMSLPFLVLLVGCYTVAHLVFVPRPYPGVVPIWRLFSRKVNPLLLLSSIFVGVLSVLALVVIEPIYMFPFALITYYVSSVAAARVVFRENKVREAHTSRPEA